MSKPLKKISLKLPTLEEDQWITAAAESDPDALPRTDEQMSTMDRIRLQRSRPKLASIKQLVSIRYSLRLLTISGLQGLVGKLVWMLCRRNMSMFTPLAMPRGANIYQIIPHPQQFFSQAGSSPASWPCRTRTGHRR